jgi:hypothetical protein
LVAALALIGAAEGLKESLDDTAKAQEPAGPQISPVATGVGGAALTIGGKDANAEATGATPTVESDAACITEDLDTSPKIQRRVTFAVNDGKVKRIRLRIREGRPAAEGATASCNDLPEKLSVQALRKTRKGKRTLNVSKSVAKTAPPQATSFTRSVTLKLKRPARKSDVGVRVRENITSPRTGDVYRCDWIYWRLNTRKPFGYPLANCNRAIERLQSQAIAVEPRPVPPECFPFRGECYSPAEAANECLDGSLTGVPDIENLPDQRMIGANSMRFWFSDGRTTTGAPSDGPPCDWYGWRIDSVWQEQEDDTGTMRRNSNYLIVVKGNDRVDREVIRLNYYRPYTCENGPSAADGIRRWAIKLRETAVYGGNTKSHTETVNDIGFSGFKLC